MVFEKPIRAWLEVSGINIPPCVYYDNIQISGNSVQLVYQASNPKLDAVFLGRAFSISEHRDTTILEATPSESTGIFRDRYDRFGYDLDLLAHSVQISVSNPVTQAVILVEVVREPPTRDRQIRIWSNNRFEVSADLIGKRIVVLHPIVYPEVVLMTEDSIDEVIMHLVGSKGGEIYYAKLRCDLNQQRLSDQSLRSLRLKFDPNDVVIHPLSEQSLSE